MGTRGRGVGALSAAATLTALALLAREVLDAPPTKFDRRVRALATDGSLDALRFALRPLFPVGLPGGFIPLAYLTARWVRRRGKRGGPAIVTAAWSGWLAHRGAKLVFRRDRPRATLDRRRTDSFPSGHTTGITTLAIVTAHVLEREGLVSPALARVIRYGAPALMGTYRVIADDHWATDVVAGWLLGGAVGGLIAESSDTFEELTPVG